MGSTQSNNLAQSPDNVPISDKDTGKVNFIWNQWFTNVQIKLNTITAKLDKSILAGYIDGLKMVWNSATSISVTSGACYIQGSSAVISFPSTLTLSSLSLSASTWYHLYGYLNAGTPAIELVTTAPASPYNGTARSKTGDTSRRYLGSVVTNASGTILQFVIDSSGLLRYTAGNIRCLANGVATTRTSVSLSSGVPITATSVELALTNTDTAVLCNIGYSPSISSNGGFTGVAPVGGLPGVLIAWITDNSQSVDYVFNSTPVNGFYIDVLGFFPGR